MNSSLKVTLINSKLTSSKTGHQILVSRLQSLLLTPMPCCLTLPYSAQVGTFSELPDLKPSADNLEAMPWALDKGEQHETAANAPGQEEEESLESTEFSINDAEVGRSEEAEGRGLEAGVSRAFSSSSKPQPPVFLPLPTVPCAKLFLGVLSFQVHPQ